MNKNIKKIGIKAVQEAGKFALKKYYTFKRSDIKLKSKYEILTKIDLDSEKRILKIIKKYFPDHSILSEEAGKINNKSDYLWIIDPIDGTTNFSIHNPLWSISVAVLYKNKIIFAFVFAPVLDEFYFAQKDKGAFLNNKKIQVSKIRKKKVIHTFCHSAKKNDIQKAIKYYKYQKLHNLDCRQMGSAAIELSYVASGRIESITIPGANSWDVSAGVLLVREAGGRVSDFEGKKWNIKSKDMIASNKAVHKSILNTIKKL